MSIFCNKMNFTSVLKSNVNYKQLVKARTVLHTHPIFSSIKTPSQMNIFMESYCFAVYDFTILLKELQKRTVCSDNTKLSLHFVESNRNIANSIDKHCVPYHKLFLSVMTNTNASTIHFETVMENIITNNNPFMDLKFEIPIHIQNFMYSGERIIKSDNTLKIASAFYLGHTDPVIDVFINYLSQYPGNYQYFKHYLKKYIELNNLVHGPTIIALLENLIKEDPCNAQNAYNTIILSGIEAIENKIKLFDNTII